MLAYFQQRSFGHICILKSAKFYPSFKERLTPKLQSSAATIRKLLRLTWSFNCDSRSLMHSNLSQILRLIGDRRQAQSTAITETWKENRTALINRLRRTKDNSLKLGGQQTENSVILKTYCAAILKILFIAFLFHFKLQIIHRLYICKLYYLTFCWTSHKVPYLKK